MVEDPVTLEERLAVAGTCIADLKLPMPALVDRMDDAVNRRWQGWPDRLYVVGKDGRVAYAGGRGPFLFAPDAMEGVLQRLVPKPRSKPAPKGG